MSGGERTEPLSSNSRYSYKWQCEINASNAGKTYTQLIFKNKFEKHEKAEYAFSVVKSHFWKMTYYDLTIKCFYFHKLKYAICESRIRLAC